MCLLVSGEVGGGGVVFAAFATPVAWSLFWRGSSSGAAGEGSGGGGNGGGGEKRVGEVEVVVAWLLVERIEKQGAFSTFCVAR